MSTLYQNDILTAIYAHAHHSATADKVALQEAAGNTISYRQLVNLVEHIAAGLLQQGFTAGDRVLLLMLPSIDLMALVLAIVRVGGVIVIADPAMGQRNFTERVTFAQVKWIMAESLFLLLQKMPFLRHWLKGRGIQIPELSQIPRVRVVNSGALPFLAALSLTALKQASPAKPLVEAPADLAADITIIFTSGTTGQPKGVVHTLASMLATVNRIRAYLELTPQAVVYDTGLLLLLPTLMIGAKAVMGRGQFNAKKTLATYQRYRVTHTLDIPANMQTLMAYLNASGQKLPDGLTDMLLGAAPISQEFLRALQAYTAPSTRIWSIYGMTELLPISFVSAHDKLAFDRAQGDLVGQPMNGIRAELADDGELILSGDGVLNRYLGHEPITRLPTGDLARLDEHGQIILLGRKKDMIIRGRFNIYPPLFEPIIKQIEGVRDAALVGVYSTAKADEEIVLFIEPAAPTMNLVQFADFIKQQLLTGVNSIDVQAHPDHIFFQPLPYNGRSHKLDKKLLRQTAVNRLNQKAAIYREYA
jgi:acyl-CoA synthetase (AMP-forming)/AMP-acid ligase II